MQRSRDQARDEPGTLKETKEALDELRTTTGQGAGALRNSAGHRVKLSPDSSVPLLTVDADDSSDGTVNVALRFTDSGIEVVTRDGTTLAVVTAAQFVGALLGNVRGDLTGSVYSTGIDNKIEGDQVDAGLLNVFTRLIAAGKNITTDPAGSMNSKDYYGGTFHGVLDSERFLKDEVGAIAGRGLAILRRLRPVWFTWKDPATDTDKGRLPGTVQAGIYVDDLAEVAPELVRQHMARAGDVHPDIDEEVEGNRPIATAVRTYEDRDVLALLIDAVQTLAADRDRERARNDELEARMDALERTHPRG